MVLLCIHKATLFYVVFVCFPVGFHGFWTVNGLDIVLWRDGGLDKIGLNSVLWQVRTTGEISLSRLF